MNLRDKRVLVTGGAKRIGAEISLALGRQGGVIAIHYHTSEQEAGETLSLLQEEGGKGVLFRGDLRQKSSIEGMVEQIKNKLGGIDILINNASIFDRTPFPEITETHWTDPWLLHVMAPFWLSSLLAPGMKKGGGGKIINIADLSGFHPRKNYLPYSVTKGALVSLTQGLALELAPEIQVNAIAPGILLWSDQKEEEKARRLAKIPLKRFGTPQDLTTLIMSLIQSDFMTGSVLRLDGGENL